MKASSKAVSALMATALAIMFGATTASAQTAACEDPADETGVLVSIGGSVTNALNGQPVADIIVVAANKFGRRSGRTNVFGNFIFQGVPSGTYALFFYQKVPEGPGDVFNYTPKPMIVSTEPCSACAPQNVVDANLQIIPWGVKTPSQMTCGASSCGERMSVYDYDPPGNQTDPYCGTSDCDGPEDFNKAPSSKLHRIIQKGFSMNPATGVPTQRISVTTYEYNAQGFVSKVDGPATGTKDWVEYDYVPMNAPNEQARGRLLATHKWVDDTHRLTTAYGEFGTGGFPALTTYPSGDFLRFSATAQGTRTEYGDGYFEEQKPTPDERGSMTVFPDQSVKVSTTVPAGKNVVTFEAFSEVNLGESVASTVRNVVDDFEVPVRTEYLDFDDNVVAIEQDVRYGPDLRPLRRYHPEYPNMFDENRYDTAGLFAGTRRADGVDARKGYDEFGQLTSVEYRLGNESVKDLKHERNLAGNLNWTKWNGRGVRNFEYDDFNRLSAIHDLERGSTLYGYETGNRRSAERRADGVLVTNHYDFSGRLTRVEKPHGAALGPGLIETADTVHVYDEPLGACADCNKDFVSTIFDDTGFTQFERRLGGDVVRKTQFIIGMERLPYFSVIAASCGMMPSPVANPVARMAAYDDLINDALACPELRLVTEFTYNSRRRESVVKYPSGRRVRYLMCTEADSGTSALGKYDTGPGASGTVPVTAVCPPGQIVKITATQPPPECLPEVYCPADGCPLGAYCPHASATVSACPNELRAVPGTGHVNPPPLNPADATQICHGQTGACIAKGACHPDNWLEQVVADEMVYEPYDALRQMRYGNGMIRRVTRDMEGRPRAVDTGSAGCFLGNWAGASFAAPVCTGGLQPNGRHECTLNDGALSGGCFGMYRSQSAYELPWGINGHASGESVTSGAVNGAWAYQYDSHQRVEHAVWTPASGSQLPFDFSYDGFDNLVATNTKTLSYNHVDNKLTGYLDASVAKSVEYDGAGRVREIASAAEMETYAYNTDNLTAAYTNAAGGSTYYRYGYTNLLTMRETSDGGLQIYGYRRANPGLPSWVLTADGFSDNLMMGAYTPVAAFAPAGNYYYLTDDDSSKVIAVTDVTGRAHIPFGDPYGEDIPYAGQKLGVAEFQPLFAGQLQFPGEPHVYNHHRFYRPDLGRYLAPDPIKTPGGNMYAYAEGNPVGLVDPMGAQAAEPKRLQCAGQLSNIPTWLCGDATQACAHAFGGGRAAATKNLPASGTKDTGEGEYRTGYSCVEHFCEGVGYVPCDYWCLETTKKMSNLEFDLSTSYGNDVLHEIAKYLSETGCDTTTCGFTASVRASNVTPAIVIMMYKADWTESSKGSCLVGGHFIDNLVSGCRNHLIDGNTITHEVGHCCGWRPNCGVDRRTGDEKIHGDFWEDSPCR